MSETHPNALIGITSADNGAIGQSEGLTKREHFAAMAMQGHLATIDPNGDDSYKSIAQMAVIQADALIAQLNKPTPSE